jgi:hypothetical protein
MLSSIYLNYIYVTLANNMPLIHEFLSTYYIIACSQSDGKSTIKKKRREKLLAVYNEELYKRRKYNLYKTIRLKIK